MRDYEPDLFGEVDADRPLPAATSGPPEAPIGERRPLVVSWGMGVNSTAMLVGMEERGIRPDLILAADTGGEKPETYAYVREFEWWLCEADFPELIVVKNDGVHGTLEQECLTNGVLPSRVYGFSGCAEKYKHRPQRKLLKTWPDALACWQRGEKVWRCIGYHAEEADRRVKVHEDDLFRYWHPLVDWGWGQEECVAAIKRADLPVPPKSACFY